MQQRGAEPAGTEDVLVGQHWCLGPETCDRIAAQRPDASRKSNSARRTAKPTLDLDLPSTLRRLARKVPCG
jgi:hypothetical protein